MKRHKRWDEIKTALPPKRTDGKVKVLGISASTHDDSLSQELLEKVMRSAEEHGAKTEIIRLCEKNINRCRGCCSTNLDDCVFPCVDTDDDTNDILRKLIDADSLVFADSVRWGKMSAEAARLIEKMTALSSDEDVIQQITGVEPIEGKPCVILCSYGYEGASLLLQSISWALNRIGYMILPYGGIHKPAILERKLIRLGAKALGFREMDWIDNCLRLAGRNLALLPLQLRGYQFDDFKVKEPSS